eukprot:26527_1
MKFSTAILTAALILSASTSNAFSTQQPLGVTRTSARSTSTLLSTVEDEKTETTLAANSDAVAQNASNNSLNDTGRAPLAPSFQKARDMTVAGFVSKLPDPSLEKPLVHFMDEYFASLAQAAAAGVKNPDGSEVTAEQAMKQMAGTLQYGVKYGLGAGPKGKFVFEDVRHMAMRGGKEDARYADEE